MRGSGVRIPVPASSKTEKYLPKILDANLSGLAGQRCDIPLAAVPVSDEVHLLRFARHRSPAAPTAPLPLASIRPTRSDGHAPRGTEAAANPSTWPRERGLHPRGNRQGRGLQPTEPPPAGWART